MNCILYGKRYTAEEAKKVGIIHEFTESDRLLESAVGLADSVVSWQEEEYDRSVLGKLKEDLYYDTVKLTMTKTTKLYPKL